MQELPDELFSMIGMHLNCNAPPPNANKALRVAWKRKCCHALQNFIHGLKRAIYDAPAGTHAYVYLWHGNKDRIKAQNAGNPHLNISMSNTHTRSRCLAASIAFAHYKCKRERPVMTVGPNAGQRANYFRFDLKNGWYLSVHPGSAVDEIETLLYILNITTSCRRTPEIGPWVMGNINEATSWIGGHVLDERLARIYRALMSYSTA